MIAQRATQQALRRFAAGKPSFVSQTAVKSFAAPVAIGSSRQIRPVATQKITDADAYQILVSQRRHRPTSPHLSIYRPQITWYASVTHRITGCIVSGGVYCFGAAYLVAPLFGWHLESATIAAAFGAWPVAAKMATKFLIAWPFTFHCLNGVRHLVWDTGAQFANKQVNATGWTVVGLSTVSALGLATLY